MGKLSLPSYNPSHKQRCWCEVLTEMNLASYVQWLSVAHVFCVRYRTDCLLWLVITLLNLELL